MSTIAAGRIAVAIGPIAYTETDEDGKPIADVVIFKKGDIIHDEALVQKLHAKHFHGALSVTHHTPHLCPPDCEKLAALDESAAPKRAAAPVPASIPVSLSSSPASAASSIGGSN